MDQLEPDSPGPVFKFFGAIGQIFWIVLIGSLVLGFAIYFLQIIL